MLTQSVDLELLYFYGSGYETEAHIESKKSILSK
jgi:hypothetical protein